MSGRTISGALLGLLVAAGAAAAEFDPGNQEILDNFIRVAFGREGGEVEDRGLRKWRAPVRVAVAGRDAERWRPWVDLHARHLRHVSGHDVALVAGERGNLVVLFVEHLAEDVLGVHRGLVRPFFEREADMERTIRESLARNTCYGIVGALWDEIVAALVVIPGGRDKSTVYQCIVEEMTQAMGLFADSDDIAYSIFNDKSPFVDLTEQDKIMLKILYDPRLKVGMRPAAARPIARQILDELRPGR